MIRGFVVCLESLKWLGPLLARLVVGYMFFVAGRGKIFPAWQSGDWAIDLSRTEAYFESLGIMLPQASAYAAAGTEFLGGACLMAGFLTRFWSLGLCVAMAVATLTAHRADFLANDAFDINAFVGLETVHLFAVAFWLAVAGAGAVSIDRAFRPKDLDD